MGKKIKKLPILDPIRVKNMNLYPFNNHLNSILTERDKASAKLSGYLKELGYE